jgi:hypothetical protein
MVVATKWTGTESDRQETKKLQLEQVLRVDASNLCKLILLAILDCQSVVQRKFGGITTFRFSITLICTWEVIIVLVFTLHPILDLRIASSQYQFTYQVA